MVYTYILQCIYIVIILVIPTYSYAVEDNVLNALDSGTQSEENQYHDISGFLINIRGIVGYSIPEIRNLIISSAKVVPDSFSSPVEGGGSVSLGFRFALTSLDVVAPAYMRFELEYAQRAPYSVYARTQAYAIENRGTLNPDYGYQASTITYALQEHAFKLRSGTQNVHLGIFIDIAANSVVVPYVGALLGVTIYDIQLNAPTVEVFNPTQSVQNVVYGNIEYLQVKSTEAAFSWGVAAGIIMIVNDYISFDLGLRYTNNIPITVGRPGNMQFTLKYNFIETLFGMSVTL